MAEHGEHADDTAIEAAESSMRREAGDIDPARAARINEIVKKCKAGAKFWKDSFDRIDFDIKFAANLKGEQWNGDTGKYVANIIQKHIRDRTASLYAKNPRVRAKRVDRLDFAVWDETQETLQAALVQMEMVISQTAPDAEPEVPEALLEFMQDVTEGKAQRDMVEKIGRTLMVLYHNALAEPQPRFKKKMKTAVRRAITCGIAWVRLGYQRAYEKNPEVIERINDITERIARIEALVSDVGDDLVEEDDAKIEELRQAMAALQSQKQVLVAEGLVHTFPFHNQVILDPQTKQISGYVGTKWMAQEFLLTVDQIKEIYEVDVSGKFASYQTNNQGQTVAALDYPQKLEEAKNMALVYEYIDKSNGTVSIVCEGYPDYLREPSAPDVKMKQFFPFFPVMFNELENPKGEVYPPSDVRLLLHQQREHNRQREALRQHRIAAQPCYLDITGLLEEEDKATIGARVPHAIHSLRGGYAPGTKSSDLIAPLETANIDMNLYETGPVFEDVLRQVGAQEANFGGTAGDTATESSIAEGSRISTMSSATDDLEETLTELARSGGEVLLQEMSKETVARIAGPGAAWPELSRDDFADQIYLEIVAGSNGRPNQAQDIANLERMGPILVQTPGINPAWLARKMVESIDEGVDLTEALLDGLPSIISMNAAQKAAAPKAGGAGNGADPNGEGPEGVPEDQGGAGGGNAERPPSVSPGGQPAFPATA